MTESTEVRLVRCPKCENLLPELADYSVYQCGGCGAVLRAKNLAVDAFPDKSNEGAAEASSKSRNSPDKGVVHLSDASDSDAKSSGGSLRYNENFPDKNNAGYTERCGNQSNVSGNTLGVHNGLDVKLRGGEVGNVVERELGNLNSTMEYACDSWRLGWMSNLHRGEKNEKEGFQGSMKRDVEGMKFSPSNYPDEGPSNSFDYLRDYGEPMRRCDNLDGANRVQYLERDRAELLKKLDELKDQLIRTCDVADKPKEKFPGDGRAITPHSYGDYTSRFPGVSSGSDGASMQYLQPDRHSSGPPYFSHYPDPFPHANGHDNFNPTKLKSNNIPGHGDPFGSQMFRRGPQQLSNHYQQQQPHPHFSGQYVDPNPELFEPYPHNAPFHQPSCPCLLCYKKNQRVSAPVPPTSFGNKIFPDNPYDPMPYHRATSAIFGLPFRNCRTDNPPMNFRGHRTHSRWSSDLNSEMDSIVRHRRQKLVFATSGRRCYPVASAAPFITCYNCFELLQLPKKAERPMKNHQKLRCGACSSIINFTIVNKKFVLSVDSYTMQNPSDIDDTCNGMMNDRVNSRGHANQFSANFSSDDYDNSWYDFQMIDREPILMSRVNDQDSSKPQDVQTFHSSSLTTSDDENSPKVLTSPREGINSVQQPIKASLSLSAPDSPLYSANNHSVNRFGKGNRSSRSDQEKAVINKAIVRQNSMKETSFATETQVSFNELSNAGVSQDSGDADREDEKSRMNESGESFFMNIIKKSFRDLSKSNHTDERKNVFVNGHHIPERLVKKAEKRAGPIHPGQYWYDFKAGFWGVISGPCLGIIPPKIEIFNYSMPENCAGGNTGVFVNGRELHQKDLDLLSARGLPADRDRSYIVEICGTVLVEDTGEELDSLGKLAPTVLKAKHGFGMKVPKAAS